MAIRINSDGKRGGFLLLLMVVSMALPASGATPYTSRLGPALRVLYRFQEEQTGRTQKQAAIAWRDAWSTVAGLTGKTSRQPSFKRAADVRLPILLDFHGDPARLALAGFVEQTRIGPICTGTLPMDRLADLVALEGLDHADMSQVLTVLKSNPTRAGPATAAATISPKRRTIPLDAGSGAIIGYLDTGVDIHHWDFRNPDGTSRILYILDLSLSCTENCDGGLGLNTYGGTLFTQQQINGALASGDSLDTIDSTGHGTHGLSIAAGSNPELPGMAPGADLIVVKGTREDGSLNFESIDIINGMTFIDQAAALAQKPYVINLSLGTMFSTHDGRSLEERAIDALVGEGRPGKAVVIAAGNASDNGGTRYRHFQDQAYAGLTTEFVIHIPEYEAATPGYGNDLVVIHLVYEVNDHLGLTLTAPDGETSVHVNDFTHITEDTDSGRVYISTMGRNTEANQAVILINDSMEAPPASGDWTLTVHGEQIGSGGHFHGWLSEVSRVGGEEPYLSGNADNNFLIGKPAGAWNGITVGSYAAHDPDTRFRTTWMDMNGEEHTDHGAESGQISAFSSTGLTRDGRYKPDTVAPGELIIGAVSKSATPWASPFSIYINHNLASPEALIIDTTMDRALGVLEGTSFSTPLITGVVARLLGINPYLDAIQARNMIRSSNQEDALTGDLPNNTWGYGRADLEIGLDPDALPPKLLIETESLPGTRIAQPVAYNLTGSGGQRPLHWQLTLGELPMGLELKDSGLIEGVCEEPGTYEFTIELRDSQTPPRVAEKAYRMEVSDLIYPVILTNQTLYARVGRSFKQILGLRGGSQPFQWSILSGSLPSGIHLMGEGILKGKPTESGCFSFTVVVQDSQSHPARKSFTLKIEAATHSIWRNRGLRAPQYNALVIDPLDTDHLLVKSQIGAIYIKESWDRGVTWDALSYTSPPFYLAISPVDSKIWGTNGNQISYFNRSESKWMHSYFCYTPPMEVTLGQPMLLDNNNLLVSVIHSVCANQPVLTRQIAKSEDSGVTWLLTSQVPQEFSNDNITEYSIFKNDLNYMVISIHCYGCSGNVRSGHLYVTDNHGQTWAKVTEDVRGFKHALISQDNPNDIIMYTSSYNRNEYNRSLDFGQTWSTHQIGSSYGITQMIRSESHPNNLLAKSNDELFNSSDSGESWSNMGIDSDSVHILLTYDLHDPGTVYALSHGNWIMISEDGGRTWDSRSDGLLSLRSLGLAINSHNPNEMLLINRSKGPYISRSGGKRWTLSQEYELLPSLSHTMPKISHSNPGLYYFKNNYGLWRSLDRGITWSRPNEDFGDYRKTNTIYSEYRTSIAALAIHSINDDIVVARLDEKSGSGYVNTDLWLSQDKGDSWMRMNSPPDSSTHYGDSTIAFSKVTTDRLYILVSDGMHYTDDFGINWHHLKQLTITHPRAVELHANNPEFIYFAEGFVIHTYDAIQNVWNNFNAEPYSLITLASDPTNPFISYGGGQGHIVKTVDGGVSWERIDSTFDGIRVWDICHHPTKSGWLYASTDEEGVYQSTDGGVTWDKITQYGSVADRVNVTRQAPDNPSFVMVGTQGYGVQTSTDSGQNFEASNGGLTDLFVNALSFDLLDANIAWAGTNNGLFLSLNQGQDWSIAPIGNAHITDIEIDRGTKPSRMFIVSLTDGVFISEDGGNSFTQSNAGLSSLNLTSVETQATANGSRYWVGMRGGDGVAWSDNGGVLWEAGPGHGLKSRLVNDLISDPNLAHRLWIACNDGVYFTDNLGHSWTPLNSGLPSGVPATSLSLAHQTGELLVSLFSSEAGGVFRGGNNNGEWVPFSTGLTELKVKSLSRKNNAFLRGTSEDTFRAATSGGGLFSTELEAPQGDIPNILTSTLPEGLSQSPYYAGLTASSGEPPYTWSLVDGSLPSGLGLNPDSGEISGNPVVSGSSIFEVMVTGTNQTSDRKAFSIRIIELRPPMLLSQPVDQTLCPGEDATFTVIARGTDPLSYQWRKDGAPIPGATEFVHPITSASTADNGSYDCEVTNGFGSLISDSANLVVEELIFISLNPQDTSLCLGDSVTLNIMANGPEPLSYQWQKGGQNLPGRNEPELMLENISSDAAGAYRCIVSNPCCTTTSEPAMLTVKEPTSFSTQPQDTTLCPGQPGELAVVATGSGPLSYLWFKDGVSIGVTTPTLVFQSLIVAHEGVYHCVVTADCGSLASEPANLVVDGPLTVHIDTPGARGLDIPSLEALISCERPPTTLVWEDLTNQSQFTENPLMLDPPRELTTRFRLTLNDESETVVRETTFLVSLNPLYFDLNGDGCNSLEDLYLLASDWLSPVTDDPNGDGFIDVRDLMYLNTSDQLPCNP